MDWDEIPKCPSSRMRFPARGLRFARPALYTLAVRARVASTSLLHLPSTHRSNGGSSLSLDSFRALISSTTRRDYARRPLAGASAHLRRQPPSEPPVLPS